MKKTTIFFAFLLFVSANAILVWFINAAESSDYVQPPIELSAKDFLPQDLLQGENYKVEEEVKSDGLINTYQLSTNYGLLTVESSAELLIRINELRALVIMEEMDRKKVFGDALVSGVKGTVKGATEFVKSPIESSKNIFKGTGQFISNLGESIFSDDPDQDNVLKVALGYDVAKRQFAFEFGIDPYTDYDPVVDRLGEIARAAVAGGLTPRAAMAAIDHTVVLAMRISGTAYGMMQLVRDNPPAKLKEINRGKLQKMDVDETLIEAFLDNYRYNPQEETLLVGELETMTGVKGVDVFIGRAALDFKQAHSLVHNLKGLAGNLEATDLQAAAMAMEKLVKGQAAETASEKELNRKLTDLESALTQALDAVQNLGPIAEKKTMESTADGMPSVDSELVKKVVDPIKSASEMGDVKQVKSIAEDLKSKSDAVGPFCDRILRLAEDFEFDSIIKFVL